MHQNGLTVRVCCVAVVAWGAMAHIAIYAVQRSQNGLTEHMYGSLLDMSKFMHAMISLLARDQVYGGIR